LQVAKLVAGGEDRDYGSSVHRRPTLISVLQHLHYDVIDLGICGDTMDETTALLKREKDLPGFHRDSTKVDRPSELALDTRLEQVADAHGLAALALRRD
jgi:hypothetical protein